METTEAPSFNTQLTDRTLWFDGDSAFDSSKLNRLMSRFDIQYVDHITQDVREFNKSVRRSKAIAVKTECHPLSTEWNIPPEYKTLDVMEYLYDRHIEVTEQMSDDEIEQRDYRLLTEIAAYKKHGLFDVLRAIIWLINTLSANNVVWGVGRGSSVSSYVLFVIGVHDVDSFAYDLNIDDFLHE